MLGLRRYNICPALFSVPLKCPYTLDMLYSQQFSCRFLNPTRVTSLVLINHQTPAQFREAAEFRYGCVLRPLSIVSNTLVRIKKDEVNIFFAFFDCTLKPIIALTGWYWPIVVLSILRYEKTTSNLVDITLCTARQTLTN